MPVPCTLLTRSLHRCHTPPSHLPARTLPRASYALISVRQDARAFHQPLAFDTSSVIITLNMFGVLSPNTVCTSVNGVKTFIHQGDCPPPEAFVTLMQGVDNLNQPLLLNQSVQVVVLVSGEVPFKVEGPLEVLLQVPAGRNLAIVGKSSEKDEARVEINVIEEFQVNGTLRLKGLEVSRASLGDQHDNKVGVPLVESK